MTLAFLTPVLAGVLLAASGVSLSDVSVLWLLLTTMAATLSAAVLATYVPHRGLRPDLGCTPCAAVSAMTVAVAVLVLRNYSADLSGPALAIAMTLFGLTQRLGQVDACSTVAAPPHAAPSSRQEG